MVAGRPCTIMYRAKNLPGHARTNYGSWCVWKQYASCDVAQRAVDDLRDRYDFYVFRLTCTRHEATEFRQPLDGNESR